MIVVPLVFVTLISGVVSMGDPTDGSFPVFYLPISDLILGLVLIVAMAFVTGIVPALQAQKLQIADALRR